MALWGPRHSASGKAAGHAWGTGSCQVGGAFWGPETLKSSHAPCEGGARSAARWSCLRRGLCQARRARTQPRSRACPGRPCAAPRAGRSGRATARAPRRRCAWPGTSRGARCARWRALGPRNTRCARAVATRSARPCAQALRRGTDCLVGNDAVAIWDLAGAPGSKNWIIPLGSGGASAVWIRPNMVPSSCRSRRC